MEPKEECILKGGHCFTRIGEVLSTYPKQYVEKCRHCGLARKAIPQETVIYYYD